MGYVGDNSEVKNSKIFKRFKRFKEKSSTGLVDTMWFGGRKLVGFALYVFLKHNQAVSMTSLKTPRAAWPRGPHLAPVHPTPKHSMPRFIIV